MERILIVEDNKTLAKLMAKKISTELHLEVDIAYTFGEAKLFLKRYQYFLALLDLNLPDAPNGEIVDYTLSTGNHVIILSGNIDKEFRKKMLQKNIIDYVNKSGVNDVNYIIQTIKRLRKNQEHTILVVDDSIVFRKQMQSMLENMFFKVITVAHGEEALGMLQVHPHVSLTLVDYHMPVMNGLDLTLEIRKQYSKNDMSIITISSNSDDEITALFLKNGANDYITKPFSKEEFSCRINNSIEALENIHIITNHAHRDYLTGLYNRRYFYNDMQDYFPIALENNESFAIAMIDIDNFKAINDTYGHDDGDKVICALADILRTQTNPKDVVARFGGEEFCVVLKDSTKEESLLLFEKILREVRNYTFTSDNKQAIHFTISIGVALDHEEGLDESLNQADMLLYKAKNSGKDQIVFH